MLVPAPGVLSTLILTMLLCDYVFGNNHPWPQCEVFCEIRGANIFSLVSSDMSSPLSLTQISK